ncbi:MAG: glycosyltransferase [Acidobacteriaceae bacterium]|nr:glycosyltransferase [Acidobacteriaceae bacterium]MBV8572240.1 glycosyltransferase [Acidobacteriaceae bacterium]
MKIVFFGLSISSAWGNGHATLLRGLFRALYSKGHELHFFERDTPYYAAHRDVQSLPYVKLHLFSDWTQTRKKAEAILASADVGIVTSYCADGVAACELVLSSRLSRTLFYDMDTPVTLSRLERGERVEYLPLSGLAGFDLVLSYTGGAALERLKTRLDATRTAALYGWVDPDIHHRVPASAQFSADLSYLGTYAADRQQALERMLVEPARALPSRTFVIAGAMYPNTDAWPPNIRHFAHVVPHGHSGFYSSSPLTLNATRGAMAAMGYCPSGRLFEAAACGTAVLSDWWEGLDTFFTPDSEILIANTTADAISQISRDRALLEFIGARARERALDCHTAAIRADRLLSLIESPRDERDEAEQVEAAFRGA